MKKEELLARLHEIMEIVGPDRAFEISENTNQRKTLWVYQAPGEDEVLAMFDCKLFPISAIKNIIYEYGQGTGDVGSNNRLRQPGAACPKPLRKENLCFFRKHETI